MRERQHMSRYQFELNASVIRSVERSFLFRIENIPFMGVNHGVYVGMKSTAAKTESAKARKKSKW